jgi:hypothetical protein
MNPRRTLAFLGLLVLVSALRAAAVAVSPVAVYIDHRERQGTLTLFNPGDRPEEVRIEFGFGYPVSDAEGNVTVPVLAQAPEGEPSAVPFLRAFPPRVRLEPGQRQVVRILARPPADLPEGEYWARALIRSRGGVAPLEERRGDVAVRIDVETMMVVAVNYRNGDVDTGLEVLGADLALSEGLAEIDLELRRTGNAAFLGRVLVELVDVDGQVVGRVEEVLAVYRDLHRRLRVPVPAGARPVTARVRMDTQRDDLPPRGALPVEPTVLELPFR